MDDSTGDVTSLYLKDVHGFHQKAVIVKDLPDDLNEETFTNFMESIVDNDMLDKCMIRNIAIVLFNEEINDKDKIQSKLMTKSLHKHFVQFIFAQQPSGIIVRGEPLLPSRDSISDYIESNLEVNVESICDSSEHWVTIRFQGISTQGLQKILGEHKVSGNQIRIEPYFPEFHDDVLKCQRPPASKAPPKSESNAPPTYGSNPRPIRGSNAPPKRQSNSSTSSSSDSDVYKNPLISGTPPVVPCDTETTENMTLPLPTPSNSIQSCGVVDDDDDDDDLYDEKFDGVVNTSAAAAAAAAADDDSIFLDDYLKREPRADNSGETSSSEIYSRKEKGEQTPRMSSGNDFQNFPATVTKTCDVKKDQIMMLKIFCFKKKCASCNVELDLRGKKVIFQGTDEESVQKGHMQMLKVLNDIVNYPENISPNLFEILNRLPSQNYIRNLLIKEKIWAYTDVLDQGDSKIIQASAFKYKEAVRAVKFILGRMSREEITYTEENFKFINSTEWKDLTSGKEKVNAVIMIHVDRGTRKVIVEGVATVVNTIAKDLQKNLDANVNKSRPKPRQHQQEQSKDRKIQMKWKGDVDLRKIGSSDHEVALLSFHLLSKKGKDFVKEFEKQHDCELTVEPGPHTVPWPLSKSGPHIPSNHKFERTDHSKRSAEHAGARRKSIDERQPPSAFRPKPVVQNFGIPMKTSYPILTLPVFNTATPQQQSDFVNKITINGTEIRVLQVDIVNCEGEILVNFFQNNAGVLKGGLVYQNFIEKGGMEMLQYIEKIWDKTNQVFMTDAAGGLKCINVCHIVLSRYSGPGCHQEFRSAIQGCFSYVKLLGVSSIVLPAVGLGRLLGYPLDFVSKCLISEAKTAAQSNSHLKKVTFASTDENCILAFMKGLQAEASSHPSPKTYQQQSFEHPRSASLIPAVMNSQHERLSTTDSDSSTDSDESDQSLHRSAEQPLYRYAPRGYNSHKHGRDRSYQNRDQKKNLMTRDLDSGDEKISVATVTMHAEHSRKGESLRSTFSKKSKELFLAYEQIEKQGKKRLNKEERKAIMKICRQKNVFVATNSGVDELKLIGEKNDIGQASKDIYKYLLKLKTEGESKDQIPEKYTRGTKKYWSIKGSKEIPQTPRYWQHFQEGRGIQDYLRIIVGKPRVEKHNVDIETFKAIKDLVEKTFKADVVGQGKDASNLRYSKLVVKKVEIIENIELYLKYFTERQMFFRKLCGLRCDRFTDIVEVQNSQKEKLAKKGPILTSKFLPKRLTTDLYHEINECYFFHGTKEEYTDNITTKGLDPRHGDDTAMFGLGIYGAESSTKADQYTDDPRSRSHRDKKMYLMRLLMGNMYVTSKPHKYKKPPCSKCLKSDCVNHSHEPFDSVVGDGPWLFREFVVYKPEQCYPEYLITYDRV